MQLKNKDKIVVAMSGGVDSSTVAAMLHNQNYKVIGITLQLYDINKKVKNNRSCCAGQDIYDAKTAADIIGIPHYVLNYKSLFNKKVIEDFAESYVRGETPIPCVRCNQKVKFKDLVKVAKNLGAKALATGHYVRKIRINNKNLLLKGIDFNKDQSYFLFTTTKKQLDFLEFPLGNFTKYETRKLAKRYILNIHDKPESQDICFVSNGNYSEIVKKFKPESYLEGEISNFNGEILGKHNGIANFTIGQRKGIKVSSTRPLFVIEIEQKTNKIIVGEKYKLQSYILKVKELNWLSNKKELNKEINCSVRLKSNHKEIKAKVKYLGKGFADIILELPYYGITPGQGCVIYNGNQVLGGGWIIKSSYKNDNKIN